MSKLLFGLIVSPCEVTWESLQGEGAVRYCGQCKLNVYNFAEMTVDEVESISNQRNGRLCASISTRADGSIYTDNCPYKLRKVRNTVRKYAPWMMLFVAWLFHQTAVHAQGLVGAPVDPRFGQSGGEIGTLRAGYDGYDDARYWVRATALFTTITAAIALAVQRVRDGQIITLLSNQNGICRQKTKNIVRKRMWQVLMLILFPIAIYAIGTIVINNISGVGWQL